MSKRWIAVAAVAALALTGCGPNIESGVVLDHRYDDAYTTYVWTGRVLVPVRHSEDWNLLIEDSDDGTWVEVSESEYESYEVGDFWERQ